MIALLAVRPCEEAGEAGPKKLVLQSVTWQLAKNAFLTVHSKHEVIYCLDEKFFVLSNAFLFSFGIWYDPNSEQTY